MLIYPIPTNKYLRLVKIQMFCISPLAFHAFHIPLIFARKQLKISKNIKKCTLFQPIKLQIFCILTIMFITTLLQYIHTLVSLFSHSHNLFQLVFTRSLSLVEAAYPIVNMIQVINKEARTT